MDQPSRHEEICLTCGSKVESLDRFTFDEAIELQKLVDLPGWTLLLRWLKSSHLTRMQELLVGDAANILELRAKARVGVDLLAAVESLPLMLEEMLPPGSEDQERNE